MDALDVPFSWLGCRLSEMTLERDEIYLSNVDGPPFTSKKVALPVVFVSDIQIPDIFHSKHPCRVCTIYPLVQKVTQSK